MQHLMVADKSLLVGDEVADALLRYAAQLGRTGSADDVTVRAIGIDGEEIRLGLLLNGGVTLVTESTTSTLPEPDNDDVVRYIAVRIADFELPPSED